MTETRPNCPPEVARVALDSVLSSQEFAGSPQLSRFLSYLVENVITGNIAELKETGIALSVFHRGPNYHPKADPIVRVEARRLRLRLESFYAGEGSGQPVRITLPKGGYVPVFQTGQDKSAPCDASQDGPPAHRRPYLRIMTGAALLMSALCALIYYAGSDGRLIAGFWNSLLDGRQPALLVIADSGLVMLQDIAGREATLQDYASGRYAERLATGSVSGEDPRYAFGRRRYTSIADLTIALQLDRRTEASRRGFETRYARDLRMQDLGDRSLILIGARQSNPWVELFEDQAALRLLHDSASGDFEIVNVRPQRGAPAAIRVTPASGQREVYGIISYHRNPRTSGWVLMVRGTSLTGTESAANLLFDDGRLLPVLRKATGRNGLRGFDLLTRDRNLGGVPTHVEIAAMNIDRDVE